MDRGVLAGGVVIVVLICGFLFGRYTAEQFKPDELASSPPAAPGIERQRCNTHDAELALLRSRVAALQADRAKLREEVSILSSSPSDRLPIDQAASSGAGPIPENPGAVDSTRDFELIESRQEHLLDHWDLIIGDHQRIKDRQLRSMFSSFYAEFLRGRSDDELRPIYDAFCIGYERYLDGKRRYEERVRNIRDARELRLAVDEFREYQVGVYRHVLPLLTKEERIAMGCTD